LDLSKVEAGKMPIDPRSFPLEELRDYIEPTFRHIADQKGLTFAVRMHERLPATMFCDPTRLQQILKNLLSNAFKFTAKGGVTMLVEPTPDDPRSVSFSVQDTGIGIPLDKHKLIFEAFQQADGTTSRKYGGTGLGLTISREMARLMGGVIEVKSAPNEGSTFTLRLPISYAGAEVVAREGSTAHDAAPEPHVPPLPADADFSGKKVLLVDDDGRNVFAIASVLKARDVQVLHADNGKVALELLQSEGDIDAVLMDTMMPEMDGLDATRAIRSLSRFRSLPIISLTAKAMKGDREKALAAGASEYVTKPVDPERLLSILHVWLNPPARSVQALMVGP
jgi:CheY-like chemotaxis protein